MSKVQFKKVDEGFDDISGNMSTISKVVDAYYKYYQVFVDHGRPKYHTPEEFERQLKTGMRNNRQNKIVDEMLNALEQDLKMGVAAYKHLKQVSNIFKRKTV